MPAHARKRQLKAPEGPVFALASYASAGDSGRKTTSHIEWPGAYQVVLLSPQTSALITYLLTLNTETIVIMAFETYFCAWHYEDMERMIPLRGFQRPPPFF